MRPRKPGGELGAAWTELVMTRLRETGRCHIYGFGVFTIATRKARQVRNPQTKELMMLPPAVTVRFTAAKRLRNAARQPQQPRGAKSDPESEAGHG